MLSIHTPRLVLVVAFEALGVTSVLVVRAPAAALSAQLI